MRALRVRRGRDLTGRQILRSTAFGRRSWSGDAQVTTPRRAQAARCASSSRPSSAVQHRVGVLADPRAPGSRGPRPPSRASPGCRARAPVVDAVGAGHLDEHVARRDVRVGDHVGRVVARAGRDARRGELVRRPRAWCAATPTPRPPGRITDSRFGAQPARVAKRGSVVPLRDGRRARRASRTGARARSARRRSRRTRGSPRRSPRAPCPARAARPCDQKLVTTSVIATIASSIAMSTYWPRPVWSRWRSAARMPMTANSAELMSPSAPTGIVTGGSSGVLVVVDARHRLDDRRVRGPVAVRAIRRCCRSPRSRRRSPAGAPRRSRRSRGPCGPSSRP